ncbi:Mediator of RNA polymerase II transcription subunit 18 [Orbilia blumenaviensis]|uniref:Mediator of RNA polymerase II transcription subunit 18 n=1 Tax=Orbilia blumenaviensis TaxID=1796055 RepID=A0AAV9U313_9PEZI
MLEPQITMHELSLFAHVPNSRAAHVERALKTVTGMSGVPLLEHHLIYKPKRNRQTIGGTASGSNSAGPANTGAAGDFYYLQLVADILKKNESQKSDPGIAGQPASATMPDPQGGDAMEVDSVQVTAEEDKVTPYEIRKQKWTIRFSDLPEVSGKRPVTSRMVHNAAVHEGDALSFVDSLGYMPISEYVLSGDYFVYHNIYITLTRILLPSQSFTPFPTSSLRKLDPADSFLLQASIKVPSANEQETMNKGVEELKTLRAELKGVIELEPGDRLSLDTRVR